LQTGFRHINGLEKYKSFEFCGLKIKKGRNGKIDEMILERNGNVIGNYDKVLVATTNYYASGAGNKFGVFKSLVSSKEANFKNSGIDQREAFTKQLFRSTSSF
jgi:hypothetical protein